MSEYVGQQPPPERRNLYGDGDDLTNRVKVALARVLHVEKRRCSAAPSNSAFHVFRTRLYPSR